MTAVTILPFLMSFVLTNLDFLPPVRIKTASGPKSEAEEGKKIKERNKD